MALGYIAIYIYAPGRRLDGLSFLMGTPGISNVYAAAIEELEAEIQALEDVPNEYDQKGIGLTKTSDHLEASATKVVH